jgi:hypothetical protein
MEMPVEAYNSVGKVERYHAPLRRAYKIICDELRDTSAEASLQALLLCSSHRHRISLKTNQIVSYAHKTAMTRTEVLHFQSVLSENRWWTIGGLQ